MTLLNRNRTRQHLKDFNFRTLFIQELGWNQHQTAPLNLTLEGATYTIEAVAEKCGLVIFVCHPGNSGEIPPYPLRRKIERTALKAAHEHLIIFVDTDRTTQVWQWVKRRLGKRAEYRQHPFRADQTGESLLEKLEGLVFELEEEERLTITEVTGRVAGALDVERVTKRFYERFKAEHQKFLDFIQGIQGQADREWYASLMLNRMMFIYFIQKRGFLDRDINYLRTRLHLIQDRHPGSFHDFYRLFLRRLFHEGLARPVEARKPELAALLGQVPFLNGGLFEVHDLEKNYPDIQIPDQAFEKLFDFFDAYTWHLDERPLRADNEINPDVLGYIFEKYVNQKQMGAYYTKEDITGYISRNTIIPFLFEAARQDCPIAFTRGGGVWRLLSNDPDNYLYEPVLKGVDLDLPVEIAAGLDKVSRRGGWNQPADPENALPTETWREHIARRKRCLEVRAKLRAGEVTSINDLITYNLDIERFALDVIVQSEGPELLRAFWKALNKISILDPTCGSGAFLFAALNILEPLYQACLEGMQGFLDDLERSERKHHPDKLKDFRETLEQAAQHPNRRYYVLKSIVVNNLYGVDIMEEAVEICKLRLFLKLAAQVETVEQIEPLPDIDFNIRAGNTLVGFTSLDAVRDAMVRGADGQRRILYPEEEASLKLIEEEAWLADKAFKRFQYMQTKEKMDAGEFSSAKQEFRHRMDRLRAELDRYLAGEYGIDHDHEAAYEKWRANHQPFHWFVEFYGIMKDGGFDVVIGNPPWREYTTVKNDYQIRGYETESSGNLYAICIERSLFVRTTKGCLGFIVQLPLVSSARMLPLRKLLLDYSGSFWFIPFDDRPGKLFDGLQHCRSVVLISKGGTDTHDPAFNSTKYQRWFTDCRTSLFKQIKYTSIITDIDNSNFFPKYQNLIHKAVFEKVKGASNRNISDYYKLRPSDYYIFYQEATQYWVKLIWGLPYYEKGNKITAPPHGRYIYFSSEKIGRSLCSVLNSSLFYLYYITCGDCFHLNDILVRKFPIIDSITQSTKLVELNMLLMENLLRNAITKTIITKDEVEISYSEFYANRSKPIIDQIDYILGEYYNFTDEELDFIINYDIKYRMGQDTVSEDEEE
ncbi:MAG: DNA methyltransferase [Thermodesulfobacteriota bacterium]